MDNEQGELALEVRTPPDADPEELAELTRRLRAELLDLDVDDVKSMAVAQAPAGAKGVELLAFGALAIQFVLQEEVLTSIVDAVRSWLRRQTARSVKLTLDGDSLEVTGLGSSEQDRLVELWIARHGADP